MVLPKPHNPWQHHIRTSFSLGVSDHTYVYSRAKFDQANLTIIEADNITQIGVEVEVNVGFFDEDALNQIKVCLFGNEDGSSRGLGLFVRKYYHSCATKSLTRSKLDEIESPTEDDKVSPDIIVRIPRSSNIRSFWTDLSTISQFAGDLVPAHVIFDNISLRSKNSLILVKVSHYSR